MSMFCFLVATIKNKKENKPTKGTIPPLFLYFYTQIY